jgi:hypothetical protein
MIFKNIAKTFLACAILSQAAGAAVIIQSNGNAGASVPLGYYPPYAPYGLTPIVYAVGWTQTSDTVDVDVMANLFSPGSPGTVNYELVDAIGPGTSFAANGIVEGTSTTPTNPANVDLFHLNLLKAGTYWLVLDSSTAAWQYNFPMQGNYVTANFAGTGLALVGLAMAMRAYRRRRTA